MGMNTTPLIREPVDMGMGMIDDNVERTIGQAQDTAWIKVGVIKTRKELPKKRSIEEFLKLKGFDPKSYNVKLTRAGTEKAVVNIFEVSIMPKATAASGTSDVFGAPALLEILMGRRKLTPHGGQAVNPDEFYNENDVWGVLDHRDEAREVGIGAGAGAFGTPAGPLISGYAGPTLRREKFPYPTGVGQTAWERFKKLARHQKEAERQADEASRVWQPTGISLGPDHDEARKRYEAMLPNLRATDPGMDFRMGPGPDVVVAKIQRRRGGILWDTVRKIPNPTSDAVNAEVEAYRQQHPDAVLRVERETRKDYTVFKRLIALTV